MSDRFDPMTLWTRNTVVWVRFWQAQNEMWLRMMGRMAEAMPHQDSHELAAEAEALCSEDAKQRKPAPQRRKPAARAKPATAKAQPSEKDLATTAG